VAVGAGGSQECPPVTTIGPHHLGLDAIGDVGQHDLEDISAKIADLLGDMLEKGSNLLNEAMTSGCEQEELFAIV
jgi:hypothetical protein